jgi:hypothetical protein
VQGLQRKNTDAFVRMWQVDASGRIGPLATTAYVRDNPAPVFHTASRLGLISAGGEVVFEVWDRDVSGFLPDTLLCVARVPLGELPAEPGAVVTAPPPNKAWDLQMAKPTVRLSPLCSVAPRDTDTKVCGARPDIASKNSHAAVPLASTRLPSAPRRLGVERGASQGLLEAHDGVQPWSEQ